MEEPILEEDVRLARRRRGKRNREKGYNFEREVRDELRRQGWVVCRCTRSRPFDLVAMRRGKLLIIDCKVHPPIKKEDIEKLKKLSILAGFPVWIVTKVKGELEAYMIEVEKELRYIADFERVTLDREETGMKLAYLSYPYTPDPKGYTRKVLKLAQKIIKKNPNLALIIPHITVDHPVIRDAIIENYGDVGFAKWDLTIIKRCDMIILGCPLDYKISRGMVWETAFAELEGIKIVRVEDLI